VCVLRVLCVARQVWSFRGVRFVVSGSCVWGDKCGVVGYCVWGKLCGFRVLCVG